MRFTSWFAALFGSVLLVGCGSDNGLHPVTGSVTVNDKPAAGALIVFHLDGPPDMKAIPPSATAGPDGSFTMATGTAGGVKPGKYIATIIWPDPSFKITEAQRMQGINPSDAPDVLKGRYATREKSDQKVEIKAGENKLPPFKLK